MFVIGAESGQGQIREILSRCTEMLPGIHVRQSGTASASFDHDMIDLKLAKKEMAAAHVVLVVVSRGFFADRSCVEKLVHLLGGDEAANQVKASAPLSTAGDDTITGAGAPGSLGDASFGAGSRCTP